MVVLLVILGGMAACSPIFVLRAGYEEAKILSRRQPIDRLVEDPEFPAQHREKLRLVLDVRDFAADSLGLNAGDSYTAFSQLDSDTLALVLSAARQDEFTPYTWWFPIVGRVPYRAYFSERSADRAVEGLQQRGYDAYVRPTSAFSTLGWFNDPMVSTLLRYDSISLANTVVHEIFHNTLYLSGQAVFNESLAQFVGARGAIVYFCEVQRDPDACARAQGGWQDELLFATYLNSLIGELEALYSREDLTTEEKVRLREPIFEAGRRRFVEEVQPHFQVLRFGAFASGPLNNAVLIARRIYYQRLDLFEEVYQLHGGDLVTTIQSIIDAAEREPRDPYGGVERLLVAAR